MAVLVAYSYEHILPGCDSGYRETDLLWSLVRFTMNATACD